MENSFDKNFIEKSQSLRALRIFQWIFAIMGISLPPTLIYSRTGYQKMHLKCVMYYFSIYSVILLSLVLWTAYINNIIVDLVVENYDLDSITSVLSLSTNISVAFVQAVMQAVTFAKHSSIRILVNRIAQLEQDILLYYQEYEWLQHDVDCNLNYHERCQRFRYRILWRYSLFVIALSILLNYVNYYLIADIMSWRDKILTLFCTLILQMKSVEFCIVIKIVDEFITSLHSYLKSLKYEITKSDGKRFMGVIFQRKLLANQLLINRTWSLVTNIEDYFAIPMLVLYLFNGIVITHTINWSYVSSFPKNGKDSLGLYRLSYITMTILNMFMPCWLTQMCIEKYKNFGSILHNIKTSDDKALNFRIREYSLQLRHQKMLFTCAGFFDINLKYFGLMVLSISTYVAILIQFKLQKETEKANIRL